jgi:hypothetical protein
LKLIPTACVPGATALAKGAPDLCPVMPFRLREPNEPTLRLPAKAKLLFVHSCRRCVHRYRDGIRRLRRNGNGHHLENRGYGSHHPRESLVRDVARTQGLARKQELSLRWL